MNFSTNQSDFDLDTCENEWTNADKTIHSALLMVFIDNITNLPVCPFIYLYFILLNIGKIEI